MTILNEFSIFCKKVYSATALLEGIPENSWNIPPDFALITGTPALIAGTLPGTTAGLGSITADIDGLL
jgi:hypothetical protein